MARKLEISELVAGLWEIETFLDVFNEFARNSTNKEYSDYANCVISMISMQSAKIGNLIGIAYRLEKGE